MLNYIVIHYTNRSLTHDQSIHDVFCNHWHTKITTNLSSFQVAVLAFPSAEEDPSYPLVDRAACQVVLVAASSAVVVRQLHVLGHSVQQQDLMTGQVPHDPQHGQHPAHLTHQEWAHEQSLPTTPTTNHLSHMLPFCDVMQYGFQQSTLTTRCSPNGT